MLNVVGRNSGRAQSAARLQSPADFNRNISLGLADNVPILPHVDVGIPVGVDGINEDQSAFDHAPLVDRAWQLTLRLLRGRRFWQAVLPAHDSRRAACCLPNCTIATRLPAIVGFSASICRLRNERATLLTVLIS